MSLNESRFRLPKEKECFGRAARDMTRRKLRSLPILQHVPVISAQAAGLRYFTDLHPGIRRHQQGENFWYQGVDGRRVRDPETLRCITLRVIPPAWRNVWICPDAQGHLQATGRDNKGRKQYRYHPQWRIIRDETKYGRLLLRAGAAPHPPTGEATLSLTGITT